MLAREHEWSRTRSMDDQQVWHISVGDLKTEAKRAQIGIPAALQPLIAVEMVLDCNDEGPLKRRRVDPHTRPRRPPRVPRRWRKSGAPKDSIGFRVPHEEWVRPQDVIPHVPRCCGFARALAYQVRRISDHRRAKQESSETKIQASGAAANHHPHGASDANAKRRVRVRLIIERRRCVRFHKFLTY